MKKLLGILFWVIGLCGITSEILAKEEIKQELDRHEQRKRK